MKKNNNFIGGIPFTGYWDYLRSKSRKQQHINGRVVVMENIDVDMSIFNQAIDFLSENYPDIIFFSTVSADEQREKLRRLFGSQKKDIVEKVLSGHALLEKNKKKEIKFVIHGGVDVFYVICSRSISIKNTFFAKILDELQYLYNLIIAGYDFQEIFEDRDNGRIYTPINSYKKESYCLHLALLEKIKRNGIFPVYDSLLAAYDLFCVPSYRIIDSDMRMQSSSPNYHPNSKAFKMLGIGNNQKSFSSEKSALLYYEKSIKGGELLILGGAINHLPFVGLYNGRNFFDRDEMITFRNTSIFSGNINDKIVLHSPNSNYFGNIAKDDFLNFWKADDLWESYKEKRLLGTENESSYSFNVIEANTDLMHSHSVEMLYDALNCNVIEFYKDTCIEELGIKTFYGRQVVHMYIAEIEKAINNEDNHISHMVIFDLAARLKRPYVFLSDILTDICIENRGFNDAFDTCNNIIVKWESFYQQLNGEAEKNNIKYSYRKAVLPNRKNIKKKIFSDDMLKNSLISVKEIAMLQDKLFATLKNKLMEFNLK